jgi:hypothetical protein
LVVLGAAMLPAGCGDGSGDFASAFRRCLGPERASLATSVKDLRFALADAGGARVEVEVGGGQMKSGDETDFTFAVPSYRHPRYVILALKNAIVDTPGPGTRAEAAYFGITIRHPERFDAVLVARRRAAPAFLKQIDRCMAPEIPLN